MGPAESKRSCARAHYHYDAVAKGVRCPITSALMSPTTPAVRRLKRRTHFARSAATIAAIKWSGAILCKDNPPRDQSPGLKKPTLQGCDQCPGLKRAEPWLTQQTRGSDPLNVMFTDQRFEALPVEGGHCRCPSSGDLLINGSRVDSTTTQWTPQIKPKMGVPWSHPAKVLLIMGSKPDPRRVRTGDSD
jgi:hypothetical protein